MAEETYGLILAFFIVYDNFNSTRICLLVKDPWFGFWKGCLIFVSKYTHLFRCECSKYMFPLFTLLSDALKIRSISEYSLEQILAHKYMLLAILSRVG